MPVRDSFLVNSNIDRIRNFRRKVAFENSGRIESEEKAKQPKVIKKGPRAIFIEKYKATGDFECAKKVLDENGYKSSRYNDEIFQSWIDEER